MFCSPLDSTQFDLYVLGRPPRFKHLGPVTKGFAGLNVSLSEARALVEQRRLDSIAVSVVPVQYRDRPHIPLAEATPLAFEEFERHKASSTDEFGPLAVSADAIGWWVFSAGNLTQQEQGFVPGALRIYIDKVLVRPLDDREYLWVSGLTYGR